MSGLLLGRRWRHRRRLDGAHGVWRLLQLVVAFGGAAVCMLPLYWLLRTSLIGTDDYFATTLVWVPRRLHWENFAAVFQVTNGLYGRWYLNTLILTVLGVVNVVVVNGLAAYAFAKLRFPGKEPLFYIYLATMMVPGETTLVPTFLIVRLFGWYDTYQGMLLPGAMSAFTVFLLRQFFAGLPREIEQAARIDGCGELRVLWYIILPLSRPILAVVATGSVTATAESYLWPLVVTQTQEIRPVAVGLPMVQGLIPPGGNPAVAMAAVLLMTLPVLVFVVVNQRNFVRGLSGALVG